MFNYPEIHPLQSKLLLQHLHILTVDGKMNQDSRRKLKQVYHLYQFIEPYLKQILLEQGSLNLVDQGAGKSYLGFILYDLLFKNSQEAVHLYAIENRPILIEQAISLAKQLAFKHMSFLELSIQDASLSDKLPSQIDVVTALHACDSATDDAISFALNKKAKIIFLVPCCQAQIARILKQNKATKLNDEILWQLWKRPHHTREFGSHITNVLRVLQLEAHGYSVNVTELVGWEHSMKNELIIAKYTGRANIKSREQLKQLLIMLGLQDSNTPFNLSIT